MTNLLPLLESLARLHFLLQSININIKELSLITHKLFGLIQIETKKECMLEQTNKYKYNINIIFYMPPWREAKEQQNNTTTI